MEVTRMAMKKSSGSKTTGRKPAKKRSVAKVTAKESTARKPARKKAVKKKKKSAKKSHALATRTPVKKPVAVQPGPPPGSVPPVEEPSRREEAIGIVTHYYSHLGVAIVQVNRGSLNTGDRIHITGHTTDISQTVTSMEYEHLHVEQAGPGQSVGIKIAGHAREHDIVYLVK
jgi:hypothetical protein